MDLNAKDSSGTLFTVKLVARDRVLITCTSLLSINFQ